MKMAMFGHAPDRGKGLGWRAKMSARKLQTTTTTTTTTTDQSE